MNEKTRVNPFQNLKLSVKLALGFAILTALIATIAIVTAVNLSNINYQNELYDFIVNADESLSLARIEQLRFEADNKQESSDLAFSHIDNSLSQLNQAKTLMKSDTNRNNAQKMIDALNHYKEEFTDYVELAKQKEAAGATRVAAASTAIQEIRKALSLEEKFIEKLSNSADIEASFHKYLILQNALDSFMEVRVTANKYVQFETDDLATSLLALVDESKANLESGRSLIEAQDVLASVNDSLVSLDKYRQSFLDYQSIVKLQQADKEEMRISAKTVADTAEEIKAGVREYLSNVSNHANTLNIELLAAALIASVTIAFVLTRSITKPLAEGLRIIEAVSQYDLTPIVPQGLLIRKDEMGKLSNAIKKILDSLRDVTEKMHYQANQLDYASTDLLHSSQEVSTGAIEVAKTVEEIAEGATDQAKRTEEGVSGAFELDRLIQHEQASVSSLFSSVDQVMALKEEGIAIVSTLVTDTQKSQNATASVQTIIMETNESAEKISKASLMIKNIADQTNLLALNAAIEAARAGDAGRGFAVVAEEIRKLAEQSNAFTDDISRTINDLIAKADSAVATMEMARQIVLTQSESVTKTNDTLILIADAMEAMKLVMAELHQSSLDMDNQKNVLIDVMETLSSTSQENAAGSEEISATVEQQTASLQELATSADSLKGLANNMKTVVNAFKL